RGGPSGSGSEELAGGARGGCNPGGPGGRAGAIVGVRDALPAHGSSGQRGGAARDSGAGVERDLGGRDRGPRGLPSALGRLSRGRGAERRSTGLLRDHGGGAPRRSVGRAPRGPLP